MARYKFQFWLDANKDDEILVAEQIDELKRKRSFSSVVRDGIMLVSELRAGRIDLLLKLYPWIADAIHPLKVAVPPTPDNSDLERQIADLKAIILQSGGVAAPPPNYPNMKPTGLQPLAGVGRKLDLPLLDDDDDATALVVRKDTRTDAGLNFLSSMSALMGQ